MLRNSSGITLIELLVVISIITIMLTLTTIAFNTYQINYNVESEIKTLYSDLMGARMRAMNENRQYVVKFSTTSYVIAIDNNGNRDYDAVDDTKIDKYSKSGLKYPLVWSLAGNTDHLVMDNRGLVNINGNIRINRASDSEYDCITISNTRIKMGKWDGTTSTCNPR